MRGVEDSKSHPIPSRFIWPMNLPLVFFSVDDSFRPISIASDTQCGSSNSKGILLFIYETRHVMCLTAVILVHAVLEVKAVPFKLEGTSGTAFGWISFYYDFVREYQRGHFSLTNFPSKLVTMVALLISGSYTN